ncbi:MAG: glucuronate isomerase, partial [Mesorhizobium sp.]
MLTLSPADLPISQPGRSRVAALSDPDLLFAPETRTLTRALYAAVKDLPIVSPHGHTDPRWYALNEPFPDPAQLLIVPDHYIFRMLFSQGVRLEELGVPRLDGSQVETDGRVIWRRFAEHYYLFRGTPTRLWLDHVFEHLFGIDEPLSASTADRHYETIAALLSQDDYRPRALFERFNIEVIATTEGALDDLKWHRMIRDSGWKGRVVTAYRPDAVVDPDFEGFLANLDRLGEITGCDTATWAGYL